MKKYHYIILLMLSFYSPFLLAKLIIVTDIDDTIRRTETLNPARALVNLMILRVPAYEGIRKLYWDLWASRDRVDFFYLSSSLKEIYDADDWLGRMQFPLGITLQRPRDLFFKQTEKKYKIDSIIQFLKNASPEDEIYFFGDTSFSDEVIYLEVVKKMGLKKAKIFIHDINGATAFKPMGTRPTLLEGISYYVSEMDLINLNNFPDTLGWVSLDSQVTILGEYYRRSALSEGVGPNLFLQLRSLYCAENGHAFAGCSVKSEIESAYFINWYYQKYLNRKYRPKMRQKI